MFILWNLIADSMEIIDQKENEQQQITDFYSKTGTVFPRLACLMQLYFNAAKILEEVKETVVFSEGDHNELIINEKFVVHAKNIIEKDYYIFDKSYLPCNEIDQSVLDPMVIVEKDAVIVAWKWYEHHLNIATKLFTIDPDFIAKPVKISLSVPSRRKTLKQLIMSFDFNIFPLSAITDKHPVTGQTYEHYSSILINQYVCTVYFFRGFLKNRPALGERALQELLADDLIKYNYFLTDVRGRNVRSYLKLPIPPLDDPTRDLFLNKLIKHDINIDEYESVYEKSSIPPHNKFSVLLYIEKSNVEYNDW